MTIIITSGKLIKEIQEEFNKLFPYLRIDFFIHANNKSKESKTIISNLLSIGNTSKIKESQKIEVSPCMTVKALEDELESKFGVFAQLYRKCGSFWQEITLTDIWTMKQQDQAGNEISSIINKATSGKLKKSRKATLV